MHNVSIGRAHVVHAVVGTGVINGTVNDQNKDGALLDGYWEIVAKFYKEFTVVDQL